MRIVSLHVMEDYFNVLVWNCDHCRASVRMHESLLSFTILFIPAASLKLQVDRDVRWCGCG